MQLEDVIAHALDHAVGEEVLAEEERFAHPEVVHALGQLLLQQQGDGDAGAAGDPEDFLVELRLDELFVQA